MKQNNELVPMSAQERKEDIDILMDSEMMDAITGGDCSSCSQQCQTCKEACSNDKKSNNGSGNGKAVRLTVAE
ncbi:MAG: hypothetical protein LBP63_08530 [Prevotellaceae bacterium]|jgi:hypothetical protein|nr:hypothetical protein [Prevotellaceae bacterium]